MHKIKSVFKYVVTLTFMVTLGYILYTFRNDAVKSVRNEVAQIEKKIKSANKSNTNTTNLKDEEVHLQELIIDKYIDYSSFLVTGISMIMTIMILFTFRDFERLDQLKEQYIEKIKEFDLKSNELDKKIGNVVSETSEIQKKINDEFNIKKEFLETGIKAKADSLSRLAQRNASLLSKEQEKIKAEQSKMEVLSSNIEKQEKFVNKIIETIGAQGIEAIAEILKTKNIIDENEYRNNVVNMSYVLFESPQIDIRMRSVHKIRNMGLQTSIPFLKEKLEVELESEIKKIIIDTIEDLLNKKNS